MNTVEKIWITKVGFLAACLEVKQAGTGCSRSHLCGYVGVRRDHPAYGKDYSEIASKINVHGGLTFSNPSDDGYDYPVAVDGLWWFGFDCAHGGDLLIEEGNITCLRSVDFVVYECESLARQLFEGVFA